MFPEFHICDKILRKSRLYVFTRYIFTLSYFTLCYNMHTIRIVSMRFITVNIALLLRATEDIERSLDSK